MKPKTIADHLKAAPKDVSPPFEVYRFFGEKGSGITFAGDQAALTGTGDYGTINELRKAVEWYVKQLNGKVTWDTK